MWYDAAVEENIPPAPVPDPPKRKCFPCVLWVALIVLALALWVAPRVREWRQAEVPGEALPEGAPSQQPQDVPVYADAKVVDRTETETHVRMTLETINGIMSPLQFYRTKLPEAGWRVTADSAGEEGGSIRARKDARSLAINFTVLGSGGARVEVVVEK